ncbi:hypothetical protein QTO34_011714 [Cnephaeus nilssonii]|uniref:Uncharacterized protein n=1 Tax=Cnephaeus nilssonii TaxID=3371016 RepID=A0AA40LES5_CNENI|nr:hypothetical protein QTO34_011714 [Eptesicus nilssonii]
MPSPQTALLFFPQSPVCSPILQQVLGGGGGRCPLPRISGQRRGSEESPPSSGSLASHSPQSRLPTRATPPHRQPWLGPAGEARPGAHSLCRGLRVAWESMKGTEGHMARGPLHRLWDLERKHATQAEARLSQHLQRLERTCLAHLRLLAWEQRQLQKQLQRLQQGIHFLKAAGKGKCPPTPGTECSRDQEAPPCARSREGTSGPPGHWSQSPGHQHSPGSTWGLPPASSRHDGLGGPVRSQEQSPPQSHVTSLLSGETLPNQAVAPGSTAPARGQPSR